MGEEVFTVITKRLVELKDEDLHSLLSRDVGIQDILPAVNEIVMEVGSKGDEALFRYTEKFDGAHLDDLRVTQEEIDELADRMLSGRHVPDGPWAASHRIVTMLAISEERYVNRLARDVGELEQRVMAHAGDADPQSFLEDLFTTRHALLTVRTMASQSGQIYGRAVRLLGADEAVKVVLRDTQDAYDRLSRITSSQLDFLTGVTEYYRARTDTKMTIAAERLAVIAAITLPVTAISSVMGMNVIVSQATDPVWVAGLVGAMIALSLVLLRWAKRQGWW